MAALVRFRLLKDKNMKWLDSKRAGAGGNGTSQRQNKRSRLSQSLCRPLDYSERWAWGVPPRKRKDSLVPLQWAEPRRSVPGHSHKHSSITASRAFDSRNMLKNKQPINLSFLVCLIIQNSSELTPWLSPTSWWCTIRCSVPPLRSLSPPLHAICPWKSFRFGGPGGFN